MIRAKVLAMCVCPAAVVPPTILAVSPPARHAFAHALHHAANRLDHKALPYAEQRLATALPCAPSIVAGRTGLPVTGGDVIGGTGAALASSPPADTPSIFAANDSANRFGYGVGGYGGGIGGYGGGGGYSGGGAGDGSQPPTPLTHLVLPPPAVSGAPEPAAWMFLVVGFGLIGAIGRRRPPVSARE